MNRALVSVLLLAVVLAGVPWTVAASPNVLYVEYPVPGNPYRIALEAPGRVWVTLPDENAIARLSVTGPGTYSVTSHELPTANSQPYDIAYAAGAVWVTEHQGNKIARFAPATETWTEYPIPTADSRPTGLAVLPGSPLQVWFAERNGNKLALLTIDGAGTAAITEYALPPANAAPEDVALNAGDPIWFTAPGISSIGRFRPSLWPSELAFATIFAGSGSRPWQMKLGSDNLPWLTDPDRNRVGHFNPGTLTTFDWYPLPKPGSIPDGLDVGGEHVWFTERGGDRLGRLNPITAAIRELDLTPGSAPTDVAVDANRCVWVTANGSARVLSWCGPYFHVSFLPLVLKK